MRKLLLRLFAFAMLVAFANSCQEPLVQDELNDGVELKSASNEKTSYIVVLQDQDLESELTKLKGYEKKQAAVKSVSEKILKRAGISDGEIGFVYGTALQGFSVKIPPGQLKKLESDPSVKYIEEDQVFTLQKPIVTISADQIINGQDVTPWGVVRVRGGAVYTGNNVAWIIDTGTDYDHPDLHVDDGAVQLGKSFISGVTSADDDNGHGTHVAGTIAAIADNNLGVVGVAAGATVIPVKVLDSGGSGSYSGVIAGVNYVASVGKSGDVANMSLSGPTYSTLDNAVYNASLIGIRFTLAAGNSSAPAKNYSPARVNGANIYTISSMDSNDKFAYFSNYGNPPVDYCEPGVSVLSTVPGGYATYSGTSMAAPHMAGILLMGTVETDGFVSGDRDKTPDPIGVVGGGVPPEPTNTPPSANFSTTINELTVTFTNTSTDADGDAVSVVSWNFGDGSSSTSSNPTHTYANDGTYNVTLTVTDGTDQSSTSKGVTVSTTPTSDITLTATVRKVRGIRYIDLNWSGATGNSVVIKVNGTDETTTANDGSETLNMARSSGTFTFQICETDGSVCSNIETLIL